MRRKFDVRQIPRFMGRAAQGAIRRLRYCLKPLLANYFTVFLWERLSTRKRNIKLNLGCGMHRIPHAINIDQRNTEAVDVLCNVAKLPYRPRSVQQIESYHVIEHLPVAKAESALRHWYELLSPGGKLVLECPDFDAAVQDYIDGNETRIGNIFGLQRFPGDFHLWGWNGHRLCKLLKDIGFVNTRRLDAQDYHRLSEPCMRVEAEKNNNV